MGAAVILNEGAILLTNWELGRSSPLASTQKIGLLTAGGSFTKSSVYTDFTLASGSGLDAITVVNATWGVPTIVTDKAVSIYGSPTPFEWTNTGSIISIYGYLVYDVGGPTGLWFELFNTPTSLDTGDGLKEQLTFTGGGCS